MRKDYPGLLIEKTAAGAPRYRVRVKGKASTKVTLPCGPGHFDFMRHYTTARAGGQPFNRNEAVSKLRKSGDLDAHIAKVLARCKARAKERGTSFDLTSEWVYGLLDKQECRCAVSQMTFTLADAGSNGRRSFAPSVDRLDNSKGYTTDNVRLTTTIVNTSLADWPERDFLAMCEAVAALRLAPSSVATSRG